MTEKKNTIAAEPTSGNQHAAARYLNCTLLNLLPNKVTDFNDSKTSIAQKLEQ